MNFVFIMLAYFVYFCTVICTFTISILHDSRGELLGTFGSFLGYRLILYAELMAIHEGLELAAHLAHSTLEVKSDSATIVAWIRPDC